MSSEKWHSLHSDLMDKFGQASLLLPWLPNEIINWEGSWLVKVLKHPMAQLMADGIKKCEIMPQDVWTSWGVQGIFVTAIMQGAGSIGDVTKYLPAKYRMYESKPEHNGKIVAVVVLGPPDTPCKLKDEGFYAPYSPQGAAAHMHRVLAHFKLDNPYQPHGTYNVSGGLH